MPNIKSAKKRVKVIAAKTAVNKSRRSRLRTTIKKAELSVESRAAESPQAVREAIKLIDQAAAKGIIHKNNASRKKSALAKKLNKAQAAE
jgi:small subunit ribosomal protein S20